ncbi:2-keto-3-deoxy-L-rhamnonate aldolase [Acinetobacter sp. MB5]|uniref:2-keto-3-deoxy-L-rhamnonate aldolase n=1 Tax=Acinetobacter sp. MB5 TaxID=2069438 RepID=UPI00196B66D7|nr:2-keto-3-deoxy-L-rhamnonate aldolase [Acinetobacter sp. MB5]
MMKISNNFKKALEAGEVQYGLWLSTTSSYMAEIAATSNYDWCLIDGEHAPNTIQNIYTQLQAIAPYKTHPIVRVLEGTQANIKQALDAGAQTLLIPMVDSAEQALQVLKATQYPPQGSRGVGASVARASRWGRIQNYMQNVSDDLCILIQVESYTAIQNIDEILEVEGIDGVFIGPADLSASLGYPDNPGHEKVQQIIEQTVQKIIASGKVAGFLAPSPDMAKKAIEWGVKFIAIGVDTMLYTQAIDERLALFKTELKQAKLKVSLSY